MYPSDLTDAQWAVLEPLLLAGRVGRHAGGRPRKLSIADSRNRPITGPDIGHKRPLPHDHWFWFLANCLGNVVVLPDALVRYRQHANNTSGPRAFSLRAALQRALEYRNYAHRVYDETQAAELLENLTNVAPEHWRLRASFAAQCFRRYARISGLRASIYAFDAGLLRRLARYLQVFLIGGYGIGKTRAQLGWQAVMKDLVVGVFRFSVPQRQSRPPG